MATRQLSCTLRHLLRCCARGDRAARGDEQLLEQFAEHRDEAAFEALVARHGPMVLEVCRRALFDAAAAEDAFQATFLVLIRKAGSIRKGELLGSWLYGVAARIAARARVEAARRRVRESAAATAAQVTDPLAEMTMRECLAVLDQEITRLPARHRAPLVLCYLKGRTRDEAAHELGYSLATLDRRLKESRERLRGRLTARGVTLSGALLAAALGEQAGRAAVPVSLKSATVSLAAGTAAGARVTALTEGVLKGMLLSKLKIVTALLVFAAVLGAGTGTLLLHIRAANRAGETPVKTLAASAPVTGQSGKKGAPGAGESAKERTARDLDKLQGTWAAVSCEANGKVDSDTVQKGLQLTIEGNRFMLRPERALHFPHGTFTLDAGKQPRTIDFTQTHGLPKEEPELIPGIYELDRATLKICRAVSGGRRPTDFTTSPGSDRELLVFRRRTVPVRDPKPGQNNETPGNNDLQQKALGFMKASPLRVLNQTRTIVFSPDGRRMAFVDYDLKRWLPSGGFAHTLHMRKTLGDKDLWMVEQGGPFGAAAFSPNGKTLAVSTGQRVRLLETATGKELLTLEAKGKADLTPNIYSIAFAPDGKTLAAVSLEESFSKSDIDISRVQPLYILWETATGKVIQNRRGNKGSCYRFLGFAPDGNPVAWELKQLQSFDRLVELSTGRVLFDLGKKQEYVPGAFLSPDRRTCYWRKDGNPDFLLRRWDLAGDKELPPLNQHDGSVVAVAFSTDGKLVATSAGGIIRLWNAASGKKLLVLRQHSNTVTSVAFSPNGKMLASSGYDGKVILWDVATGKIRHQLPGHHGRVEEVYFSPDGTLLVSAAMTVNEKNQRQEETFVWKVSSGARN